ncbi:MAG: PAS domain S-box protein [Deltaproteobacteria bacterium]|nr:PAS domain S-box protein [Deltaproteobacteria bacterium]
MTSRPGSDAAQAAVASLAAVARERARLLAPSLFVGAGVYIVAAGPLGIAPPAAVHAIDVCLLALLGAFAYAQARGRVPLRWCHAVSATMLALALAATVLPLAVTGDDVYAILYVMLIASSGVILDTRLAVATIAGANAATVPIFLANDGPHTALLVCASLTAAAFALLVHALMRRALVRAELTRLELNRRIEELQQTRNKHARLSQRLGRSEASFRALVESSPDAMFIIADRTHDFGIRWVNASLLRLLGIEREDELLGRRTVDTFVHPAERARLAAFHLEPHRGLDPGGLPLRYVRSDGAVVHVHATARRVTYEGDDAVLVVARDMTDHLARERERAAIRKSEERHRLLFDGSPLPISVYDAETARFVAVNAKMVELYGYTREELLAMSNAEIQVSAADDVVRHRRKDGVLVDIDLTTHRLEIDGRPCILAIGIDVTTARRVEEQLRQAQRMEAIGQLAGGVAHDFNNILAVIMSNAEHVTDELGPDHPLAAEIHEIEAATARGAGLTRQLLAFSRKQRRNVTEVALNSVVTNLEKMLSRIVGEDIAMTARLEPKLGTVRADAGQLEQVLMNLVVNARDAMPAGGALALETSNVELDEVHAAELGARPGRHVLLAVSDTGCGMTPETRARIFEPFFTTKPVGKGTGLGLSTVFGIVAQSEGAIAVYSEVGRGTTFRVYLPCVDAAAPAAVAEPAARPAPLRGSETVLVVEDDARLRSAVGRQLRSFGYRMIEAHDAQRALEIAASYGGAIDLVLTDLVMPGMDGRTLAARIGAARPATKVLYMSGYTEHAAVKNTALSPGDRLLEKPFSALALSHAIRELLDAAA